MDDARRLAGGPVALLAGLFILTLGWPTPSASQSIAGTLDVPGRWLVTLQDMDGASVSVGLSDVDGAFELLTPGPGHYRVIAERVGYEALQSALLEVRADERVRSEFGAAQDAASLSHTADPPGQCVSRPSVGSPVGEAWHRARVALTIAAAVEASGELLLDANVYGRELASDGRTVIREAPVEARSGVTRVGPRADATDLVERGFVREDAGGGYRFFAPEPSVLVSDAFQDSHCLQLRPDGGPALVGLSFEPVPGRDDKPDVAGVLWIEASTGRLVMLEFAYRNFDLGIPLGGAGGRTVFAELPDGSWVTPETWLRMPLLEVELGGDSLPDQRWALGGISEEGVRLQSARSRAEAWSLAVQAGAVEGRVTLHDGGDPLEGARVVIPGTPHEAITDAAGRYRLDGLLGGVYAVTARHPRLDALSIGTGTRLAAVQEGTSSRLDLFAPRPEEAATELCGGARGAGARVLLSGQVIDSLSGEPLVGAPLTIRFRDARRAGNPYHEARITSGNGGEYLYCDLPPATAVRVRALTPGGDGEDDIEFVTGMRGVERRNLVVSLSTEQNPAGLFGMVREYGSRRPLDAAEVRVRDSDLRVITNRNGFFAIEGLPNGLFVLEVSQLGYQTREVVVRLSGTGAMKMDVELDIDAIPIEGITVTAVPRRLFGDMVDLQRRMELGFGEYVMKEELEARGGSLASALQGHSGVHPVASTDRLGGTYLVLRRAQDLTDPTNPQAFVWCYPAVWVDGQRWSTPRVGGIGHEPVDFTEFLSIDMEAVEVYKGGASVPGEFGGGDAACGAIVIWTRRGGVIARGESRRGIGGNGGEGGEGGGPG